MKIARLIQFIIRQWHHLRGHRNNVICRFDYYDKPFATDGHWSNGQQAEVCVCGAIYYSSHAYKLSKWFFNPKTHKLPHVYKWRYGAGFTKHWFNRLFGND